MIQGAGLPPLNVPANGADGMFSYQHTSGQPSSLQLPVLSDTAAAAADGTHPGGASYQSPLYDDVLQQHYVRVQETLLNSVDTKIQHVESQLRENQMLLRRTDEEKTSLGVALYQSKSEVNKLNSSLATTRHALQEAESERKTLTKERSVTESELQEILRQNKSLQKDLETTRHQLEENVVKVRQLQEINTSFTSDLKIQKRIHNKLKKELEVSDERRKQAEVDLEEEKQKLEMSINKRNELKKSLESQQSEAIVAQKAIDNMHREITGLTSIKEATEKQWAEAITAMSKRDKAFQILADSKEKLSMSKLEMDNMIRVLKLERDEALKRLTDKEKECSDLQQNLDDTRMSHKKLAEKYNEAKDAVAQAETAESLFRQEVGQLHQSDEFKEAEMGRKDETITTLKSKLTDMRNKFEKEMRLHVSVEQAVRREEAVKQQAAAEIKAISRDEETKNVNLRRENAELQTRLHESTEQVHHLTREREIMNSQYREISTHYSKLYEEAKHMIYSLERREHDLNYLKAKMSQKEADNTGTFNMIVNKLKKDIADGQIEHDRIQQLWLESQKDALKAKDRVNQLENENAFMQTKLGITDAVKAKTSKELDESKNETYDQKLESAKLFNELMRLQPMLEELKEKNRTLEQQLHEAGLRLEEAHMNSTTSTQMLRTEIRRLYQDRSELKRIRTEREVASLNIERKTELFREMIDKLKAERYELQRSNYALKRKAEEMERKYFDAKLQARRAMEKQKVDSARDAAAAHASGGVGAFRPGGPMQQGQPGSESQAWASLTALSNLGMENPIDPAASLNVNTANGLNNQQVQSRDVREIPDFEAWRLKIDSLEKEKNYLINENKKLGKDVEEMAERISKIERHLFEEKMKCRAAERGQKQQDEEIKELGQRCKRAEKVAAHMEQQVKEAKPNYKIDYQMLGDPEPSTQLLAALLTREVVVRDSQARGSNGVGNVGAGAGTGGKRGNEIVSAMGGDRTAPLPAAMPRRGSILKASSNSINDNCNAMDTSHIADFSQLLITPAGHDSGAASVPSAADASMNAHRPPLSRGRRPPHPPSFLAHMTGTANIGASTHMSQLSTFDNTATTPPSINRARLSIDAKGASRSPSRQSVTSASSAVSALHRSPGSVGGHSQPSSSSRLRSAKDSDLSLDTRTLLKNMMRTSRLTYSQQKFLDLLVSDSQSLPAHPSSGMHARMHGSTPTPNTHPSAFQEDAGDIGGYEMTGDNHGRTSSVGSRGSVMGRSPRQRMVARAAELAEWISKPGIRTLAQIKCAGSYETEAYRTRPMKDMTIEKSRFQDKLEGIDVPKDSLKAPRRHGCGRNNGKDTNGDTGTGAGSAAQAEPEIDEFDMVQQEISERRQWLDDMIALGRGAQFKRQIQSEIAQRVSRLEQIHKERLKQDSTGPSNRRNAATKPT